MSLSADSDEYQELCFSAKEHRNAVTAAKAAKEFMYESACKAISAGMTAADAAKLVGMSDEHISRIYRAWRGQQHE